MSNNVILGDFRRRGSGDDKEDPQLESELSKRNEVLKELITFRDSLTLESVLGMENPDSNLGIVPSVDLSENKYDGLNLEERDSESEYFFGQRVVYNELIKDATSRGQELDEEDQKKSPNALCTVS